MASEQELLSSAAEHAKRTTKSWDWYLAKIRSDKNYAYETVEWYRAGADLEAIKHLPPPAPTSALDTARARIFLAEAPLDCLQAPAWMTPVCTADQAYRHFYTADTIKQLRARFGCVEAWCDCRNPTAYSVAQQMVADLKLDGAWGQCETTAEFDHATANGATRLVGNINTSVLDDARLARIASGEILVSVELYRNKQPNLQPDWRNANAGIGGNCIAVYASASEGAVYTPVASYISAGLYVPHNDSVYGVGLTSADWNNLG